MLTIVMMLTLAVVPASAAGPQVSVALTADKTTIQRSSSDQEILITVTFNNPAAEADRPTAIGFNLKSADGNLILAEKAEKRAKLDYSYVNDDDDTVTETANATYKKGIFTFLYGDVTKTLPIKESSLTLMTIKATIKANTPVGKYTISTEKMAIADTGSVGVIAKTIYDTNQTLTINVVEAISSDLPVAITAPVKGGTPETTITGTNYTGSITWTPTDTGGKFAANTAYTANVTLTAKEGYQFARDVNPTVAGATRVTNVNAKNSGKTLEFKAAFAKTGTATLKGIDIITNPALEMAVPTAAPNATATNERSLAVTGVYDDGSGGPVAVNWEITTDPEPKGVSLVGSTLKVTNEAEAGTFRIKATSAEGYTDAETVTITKAAPATTAIVATAPATTNITIPNGSTITSGKCSYKVYDQYGAAMTGIGATWKMNPETVAGVTLTTDGAIAVNNSAKTGTVKLYAESGGVKSNEITFNIAREDSVATTLTIEGSADSVNVPTVTKPGTTECAYAAYDAIVKDQYGEAMTGQTIAWSVTENPGVAINNGQLTVTNKATAGNVTITAKSGTLNATKNVTINKDTAKVSIVEITGQGGATPVTIITCTGSQRSESYTATVYDQYGEEKQDDVTWSLDPTYSGVDYEIPGANNIVTLKVAPSADAGTFKLVATSKTVTTVKGELEITVQKKHDVSSNINFNDGSLTYNGAGQKYEKASVTAGTGGKWTYTYAVKSGGTGTLDAAGLPKTVGTYTVTATYEDSLNIGSKSATLTITPKKVNIPAVDTTKYTYDGTAKTYNIPTSLYYTVTGNIQTNANEAGHIVTVTLKDSPNTTWSDDSVGQQIFMFKIMKATPTGEPSYTKITEAGKTLAAAALTIGTLKPNAATYQLQWVNDSGAILANDTKVEKNQAYKWLFTPADTANYNTLTGSLTPYYVASSGGSHVSKVQKPEITIIGSGKADLSADGRTATITAAAGHELVSVVLNGKEMGKVEKLTGLKTGDKATITFRAKTDGKAEMDKIIAQKASKLTLMARSKKTAKLNIKVVVKGDLKAITDAGYTVKYKFYRSTKKSAGYKAVLTKKAPSYVNTYGKKGTMYYYKARVMIYDKNGNFVAQTALKQCKYANRLWTK